ncbi:hypothetical protein BVRB_8g197780 [Beta vulgaris subsp. vulgaris]|nr:hypothetical protein BVRB_8g197780 [Beta vulgaris subsp. vulgaris]
MAIVSSAVKASANAGLLVVAIGGLLEIWLAVATPRIAKPGCEDRCGNVSIPYPFGIGPNCYHNPWFDVECWLESDGFLMKWTTELDFIISGSQINWDPVKGERTFVTTNPCHGFCISRESDDTSHLMEKPSYNLTGSPFLFSRKRNVLLVSGCGGGVLLRNKNMQTVAGCAAVCINRSAPGKECYGVGCCQTTFSYSIDYYDFEFVNMALARPTNDLSYSSPCTYAVLVDSTWIINKSKDINFSNYDNEICGQGEANVVLEWTVTDLPIQSPSYANSSCVYKTASVDDAGGYICRCREEFFEGNPYLPYGCQVVSECEDCVQECISLGNHTFGCPQKAEKVNTTSIALGLGLGISFVVFLVLFGVYWLYHMLKRRRNIRLKAMYFEKNGGLLLKQQLPSEEGDNIFTSDELEKATDQYNEDRVLGQGGQGTVYKEDFPITWEMRLQIDFGISKALGIDQTHITTQVVGTFGYLDPEYFQSNQFTDKSDVYSFGVVLVELLSGQKAIRVIDDEERGLVAWFLGHMEDSSLYDILDARVIREGEEDEIMMVAHLAKRCVNLDGKRRPTMKEVAAELETVRQGEKVL